MNLQEKCDLLTEYIKRLKLCIKWFQELEASYVFEHEKLQNRLEKAELRCGETGMISICCTLVLNKVACESDSKLGMFGCRNPIEEQGGGVEFNYSGPQEESCFFAREIRTGGMR